MKSSRLLRRSISTVGRPLRPTLRYGFYLPTQAAAKPTTGLRFFGVATRGLKDGEAAIVYKYQLPRRSRRTVLLNSICKLSVACVVIVTLITINEFVLPWMFERAFPEGLEDHDEAEEIPELFIPIPFTQKLVDLPPYDPLGPECEAYRSVMNDKDLTKRLKVSVVKACYGLAKADKHVCRTLGTNNPKIGRYWTDVMYPASPPPEYQRKGILFTSAGPKVTSRPVDYQTASRTRRVMDIQTLAISALAFLKSLTKQELANFERWALGKPDSPQQLSESAEPKLPTGPPRQLPSIEAAFEEMARHRAKREGGKQDQGALEAASSKTTTRVPSDDGGAVNGNTNQTSAASPERLTSSIDLLRGHFSTPLLKFVESFRRNHRYQAPLPSRGSVMVTARVEVVGPTGNAILDCVSWWDPKTRKFDEPASFVALKTLTANKAITRR